MLSNISSKRLRRKDINERGARGTLASLEPFDPILGVRLGHHFVDSVDLPYRNPDPQPLPVDDICTRQSEVCIDDHRDPTRRQSLEQPDGTVASTAHAQDVVAGKEVTQVLVPLLKTCNGVKEAEVAIALDVHALTISDERSTLSARCLMYSPMLRGVFSTS